jgi:hypothetical protein
VLRNILVGERRGAGKDTVGIMELEIYGRVAKKIVAREDEVRCG